LGAGRQPSRAEPTHASLTRTMRASPPLAPAMHGQAWNGVQGISFGAFRVEGWGCRGWKSILPSTPCTRPWQQQTHPPRWVPAQPFTANQRPLIGQRMTAQHHTSNQRPLIGRWTTAQHYTP